MRAWWNRPHVDWALKGKLGWPNYDRAGFRWMEGKATFSNFGDGPAHRVAVHIHRGTKLSQVLATSPLVKPGDAIEFEAGVMADHWEDTHLWVTWTPPPIRRHCERASTKLLISEHFELTDIAERKLNEFREEKG